MKLSISTIAIPTITTVVDIAKKRNMSVTSMNIAGVAMNITGIAVASRVMFTR
jgi:hypothetical protein